MKADKTDKSVNLRIPKDKSSRIPEIYPSSRPAYLTDLRPQAVSQADLIQRIQCSLPPYRIESLQRISPVNDRSASAKPAFLPSPLRPRRLGNNTFPEVIQGVLEIQSAHPQSVFSRLTYKQFKALTKRKKGHRRMEVPIDAWIYMKKLAERKKWYTFKTWREAVETASDKPMQQQQARKEAKDYLETLKCVRIGFVEGINFGNIMSGVALIQSLQELGYHGKITFVCPDSVKEKIIRLKPALQTMVYEQKDEFSAEKNYPAPEIVDDDTLSFMANGDFLNDPPTSLQLLNYLRANVCIILNPYGWKPGNQRRVLRRPPPSPDQAEETSVAPQSAEEALMDPELDAEALYVRSLESPKNLSKFITDKLGPENQEKKEGLLALVEAAQTGRSFLQPVYGLHTLDEKGLVNAEATLSEGVHQSKASGKPTILLMLNKARIDYLPPYSPPWLLRGDIARQGIKQQIDGLQAGEILILDCLGLPDAIFTQLFKLASLPPLIEGANTSNLVQLIGKPWMSPRTNTTEFPFAGRKEYASTVAFLHNVRDALTASSTMTEKIEEAPEHTSIGELTTLLTFIYQIRYALDKPELATEETFGDDLAPFLKRLDTAEALGVKEATGWIGLIKPYVSKRAPRLPMHTVPLSETEIYTQLVDKDFPSLKNAVEIKLTALKSSLKEKLGDGSKEAYGLKPENITLIARMIDQSLDPRSAVSDYFAAVHESTREDERNQVLQGILLLLKSRQPAVKPK